MRTELGALWRFSFNYVYVCQSSFHCECTSIRSLRHNNANMRRGGKIKIPMALSGIVKCLSFTEPTHLVMVLSEMKEM